MYIGKLLTIILIATFVFVGVIGVVYSGIMMGHGDIVGCPLTGHDAAVCSMGPLEHLSAWQVMFAAVPAQAAVVLLLMLLALFCVFRLSQYLQLLRPSPQIVLVLYEREIGVYDPLRQFIARGLMHPKIF